MTRPGIEAGVTRGESKRCFDAIDELPTVICLAITLQKIGDDGQLKDPVPFGGHLRPRWSNRVQVAEAWNPTNNVGSRSSAWGEIRGS